MLDVNNFFFAHTQKKSKKKVCIKKNCIFAFVKNK